MPLNTRTFKNEEAASRQLQRTIEREERRRKRLTRALWGAGVLVLLGVVLISGGLTVQALRRPASASATSQLLAEVPVPVPLSAAVSEPPVAASAIPEAKGSVEPAPAPKRKAVPKKAASTKSSARTPSTNSSSSTSVQHFAIAIGRAGYEPESITAQSGRSITMTVGKGEGCAAGFNMPKLGVHADNSSGPVTIRLGKVKAGTYIYTCSMGMVSGELVVR